MVDTVVSTFYLIRHGEAEINVRPDLWEMTDCRLTERGRAQVESLAQRLRSAPCGVIYASTMRRARQTADILASVLHVPLIGAPWLREMNWGDLDHASLAEIRSTAPGLIDAGKHSWDQAFPHGESVRGFYDRVATGIALLLKDPSLPAHVALVGHGGSIEVALTCLLELPSLATDRFVIDNASLSVVIQRRIVGRVLPMLALHNDTSHWRAAGL